MPLMPPYWFKCLNVLFHNASIYSFVCYRTMKAICMLPPRCFTLPHIIYSLIPHTFTGPLLYSQAMFCVLFYKTEKIHEQVVTTGDVMESALGLYCQRSQQGPKEIILKEEPLCKQQGKEPWRKGESVAGAEVLRGK